MTRLRDLFLSFLILGSLACASCGPKGTASGSGGRASDFALRDIDGKTVHLSDYLGKNVVVINFWATWCAPCMGEMPHLQRLWEAHRADGLVVLGVSMDGPESVANVGPTARRLGLTYPVLLDEETRVIGAYNPRKDAPFNVIIGRDGVIAKTTVGYSAGDEVTLEQELKVLLGSKM